MTESRVTLYSFSFRHHGHYSSLHRLLHYSPDCHAIDATFPLGRIVGKSLHEPLERRWLRWNERRLRPVFSRNERQCVHYIHPENTIFESDLWKGSHAMVLTCHQLGDSLREIADNPSFANFFRALKNADRAVLMSSGSLKDYENFCDPGRLRVIPHGVDVDFFRPAAQPPNRPMVLTVGNWLRDYDLWADVALRLAEVVPEVEFAVAAMPGTVSAIRPRVEGALGGRVRFLHGLTDEELRQLYQDASVMFLPLKDASANNAVLESMACGVPLVVSDLPAVREYAGDCAVYFKGGNADESIATLETLLKDSPRRTEIGKSARQRAVSQLGWQVIARRYKDLYLETLAAK